MLSDYKVECLARGKIVIHAPHAPWEPSFIPEEQPPILEPNQTYYVHVERSGRMFLSTAAKVRGTVHKYGPLVTDSNGQWRPIGDKQCR